jgi:hypothetical protein
VRRAEAAALAAVLELDVDVDDMLHGHALASDSRGIRV